ncbi:MAG TPA: hypothetical protein VH255_00530 [Verrucomicrobiae bacterium]|nr:hypothetical protein [Verrucomicrobiae bacterium]
MKNLLFSALFCLLVGSVSLTFGADTADTAATPWKFSLQAKMDAASRSFVEMTKLGKLKTDESAHWQFEFEHTHTYSDERILFVRLKYDPYDGSVTFPKLSHFEFGYGDIFPLETIYRTSSNGEAWEEPNTCYIKFCQNF